MKESILNGATLKENLANDIAGGGRFLDAYGALKYAEKFSPDAQGYPLPDGLYNIRNLKSGLVLDVPNSGGTGTQVIQYTQNYASNQIWRVEHQSNGNYTLTPMHSTLLKLTVENGSAENSDKAIVRPGFVEDIQPSPK